MPATNKPIKILLVEDSLTQLKKLEMILTKAGYEVATATDGVKGINRAHSDAPDLIISDILMPELNGYQFCRLIKTDPLRQHIPVILLTNLGEPQDRFWGIESGADAYIVKENEHKELIPQIKSLLARAAEASTEQVQTQTEPDVQHTSRATYMLDKLILESTINAKTRGIIRNAEEPNQLMANFFELLSKLINYDLAQIVIRSGDYYYCNLDVQGEKTLGQDTITALNQAVSQKLKIGIPFENQSLHIFHRENIETKLTGVPAALSKIAFPILIDEKTMGVLAVHSLRNNAYSTEMEHTLRLVCQQVGAMVKYFLALEQNIGWQQKYAETMKKNIGGRFKEIAEGLQRLSETLTSDIEQSALQKLKAVANEGQQMLIDKASGLSQKAK